MMAGNPSRWSMHPPSQQASFFPSQYVVGSSSSSSSLPCNSLPNNNQELPQSWSQLLLDGFSGGEEEDRFGVGLVGHFQQKKLENWEDLLNPYSRLVPLVLADVKQEIPQNSNLYGRGDHEEFHHHHHNQPPCRPPTTWPQQVLPVSSPSSCVTTLTSNMLDFSYNNNPNIGIANQHPPDQSSECNSTASEGVCKKPRVQPSSSQPPLKVRKEKLGDRIAALHQLVSPFGKTDTASVLLEAIGYIRFLQGQIEALSSPYLTTASSNNTRNQHSVQGERNFVFPEDPGQLLNDICLKRKGGPNQQESQDHHHKPKDLRSRGLCLVPVSCTQHVGSENGADYWAPAIGGGEGF